MMFSFPCRQNSLLQDLNINNFFCDLVAESCQNAVHVIMEYLFCCELGITSKQFWNHVNLLSLK